MEKRLVLAIAMSVLILMSWSFLTRSSQPIVQQDVTIGSTAETLKVEPVLQTSPEPLDLAPEEIMVQGTPDFDLSFIKSGAAIQQAIFKQYQDYKFTLYTGLGLAVDNLVFKKIDAAAGALTFTYADAYKKVVKKFIIPNTGYNIGLEIEVTNISATDLPFTIPLTLGNLDFSAHNLENRYQGALVAGQEKTSQVNPRKEQAIAQIKFMGIKDRYFCLIADAPSGNYTGRITKLNANTYSYSIVSERFMIAPGQTLKQKFNIYLGPQKLQIINAVNPAWSAIINYGFFDFISQILLQLLEFLHRLVHNWGLAIVILSFIVYFVLYPLTLKQMRSAKEMQEKMQMLQPQIEELKKKYKDNPQKMNKEIMALYQKYKVHNISGCLIPVLLQLPIFIALLNGLQRSFDLKGASFLWIKDLSAPDKLWTLPISLPILGNELNMLPLLITVNMFIQQKVSTVSAAADPATAEQQKLTKIIMPLIFGIAFYHAPAGLTIYWLINGILSVMLQLKINRTK